MENLKIINGYTIQPPQVDMYGGFEITVINPDGTLLAFLNNTKKEAAIERAMKYIESNT